ncbi:hypothetical protein BJ322DRAFT_1186412 [Thelephora terrestris]|uniref:Uncharacterized protein n=1 Tax=Thelephora terrestris TaxID=56493 RepID=A0A9P6HHG0_9AGAM|nr:hypothetical protein BJ322DRAFT_1186412 [Thelephora terrestris]
MSQNTAETSVSSLSHSQQLQRPSQIKTVVTVPPWARDEPPSPTDQHDFLPVAPHESLRRPSNAASYQSSSPRPSRWWTFTLPRPQRTNTLEKDVLGGVERDLRGNLLKDRLSSRWSGSGDNTTLRNSEQNENTRGGWNLHIDLPRSPGKPFTLSHTQSPGWDTPWSARLPTSIARANGNGNAYNGMLSEEHQQEEDHEQDPWKQRKKLLRNFLLTNGYVPLLFRFVNITFTTSALAIAIRIRALEMSNHVRGAVGSSPVLVIIFAPLTLAHVMIAIYLEYFGRPLGLWRTSRKLAHTLLETLFICAWSAALSLCLDNYFTSVIPCSEEGKEWYNELPPPPTIPDVGSVGPRICRNQLALIFLVLIGLIMYCMSLVISLYRIFEKVKYIGPTNSSSWRQ